jgi:superfamily II DNA/RNA helicase
VCLPSQIEEEEKKLKAAIKEAEKQYSKVTSEMKKLETKSKEFEELEERFVFSSLCHFRFRHRVASFALFLEEEGFSAQWF